MKRALTIMLCHTLKGAGMSCLFTMLQDENHEPIGVTRLAAITGYDRKSVSQGLQKMAELGLVQWVKRYDSWQLTEQGILLRARGNEYPSEGELLPVPQRSSSSYIESNINNDSLKQQLRNREGEILPLVDALVKHGCPRRTAKLAIEAALINRGESAEQIQAEIDQWFTYVKSDNGVGINNPPAFVAAKIKNGEPAPETAEKTWYTKEEFKELLQR